MRNRPRVQTAVVLQDAVTCRQMGDFKYELHKHCFGGLLRDAKPHRISNPGLRQSRTVLRVSQVAAFELEIGWDRLLMVRRAANAAPACSKRQPGRMRKRKIIGAMRRRKEWTRQAAHSQILSSYRLALAGIAIVITQPNLANRNRFSQNSSYGSSFDASGALEPESE